MTSQYVEVVPILDAFEMNAARMVDESEWPDWLMDARRRPSGGIHSIYKPTPDFTDWVVLNPSGALLVTSDDFIIKHSNGNLESMPKLEFLTKYKKYK